MNRIKAAQSVLLSQVASQSNAGIGALNHNHPFKIAIQCTDYSAMIFD